MEDPQFAIYTYTSLVRAVCCPPWKKRNIHSFVAPHLFETANKCASRE